MKSLTPVQRRFVEEGRCVWCGGSAGTRPRKGDQLRERECTSCRDTQHTTEPNGPDFGAMTHSVNFEFKRRMGYSTAEPGGPDEPENENKEEK